MSGYLSQDVSSLQTVSAPGLADRDIVGIPTSTFPTRSFKKATVGFFGSITFLYAAAFFLSAHI